MVKPSVGNTTHFFHKMHPSLRDCLALQLKNGGNGDFPVLNELCRSCQKNYAMDTRFGPSRSKCEFDQQLHDFGWQWTGGRLHSGSP